MTTAVIRKVSVLADHASQRLACPRLVMKLLTFSNTGCILSNSKVTVRALNCRDLSLIFLFWASLLFCLPTYLYYGHNSNNLKHVENTVLIKFSYQLLCISQ